MTVDKSLFKHVTQIRVRNFEVDWQGIVHNAIYLQYFEIGRIEYLKQLGVKINMDTIQEESKIVLVRNEIDYKAPTRFDDLLTIFSRIAFIRNSSFAMEGILERAGTNEVIATNVAHHVWLDPVTDRPRTIRDEFRKLVQRFEGKNCEIHWPTIEA